MITETEFFTRVRQLVTGGPETVRDANDQILALAAELTVARDRRNRKKLKQILFNGPAASELVRSEDSFTEVTADEVLQVRMNHAQDLHCGRMTCTRCNGRDVE